MKILKTGDPKFEKKEMAVSCHLCNTHFIAEPDEYTRYIEYHNPSYTIITDTVTCPYCGYKNGISSYF